MADAALFVGTWELISWEIRQPHGTIHYPYGKDVVGYLNHIGRLIYVCRNHGSEAKLLLGSKGIG